MTNKPIKRPVSIYITLLFLISLAVYSAYDAFLLSLRYDGVIGDIIIYSHYSPAFIFIITAISLYLNKAWSKSLIYFLSICYVIFWSFTSFRGVREMMKYDRYDISILDICISLIPESLLLFACIGSCFVVTKYFNRISKPDRVAPL